MAEKEHFTNGRVWAFSIGFGVVSLAFGAQIAGWPHSMTIGSFYGTGSSVILFAVILMRRSYLAKSLNPAINTYPQDSGIVPGIPTISALLGQEANVDFNAKQFFALAHYSPITAEVEKNIKTIAQQTSPADKEAFYARFIGVGLVAYQHDISALTIFGSQLRAIEEMSSRGLIPMQEVQKHYDKAALEYPKTYNDYAFEEWLNYLKLRMLIVVYPSKMVELSFHGRDFLKYLAHIGKKTSLLAN